MNIPLDKEEVRCFGYLCNLKRQCCRYLTMEKDPIGLLAYTESLYKSSSDGITVCSEYLEEVDLLKELLKWQEQQ
jgi:hypothetical protein